MSATLEISCPTCGKGFKVPAEFAGRTIKCKNCQTPFAVPGGTPPAAAPTRAARPAAAKPAAPAVAKPAADPGAPLAFKDDPPAKPADDDEDEANPYGVQHDALDVPRCPFCANELDPPDTKVCLTCGYDLLQRKRHGSKKVYELTTGDYILHWLPGVACVIAIIVFLTIGIVCGLNMRDWLTGSIVDKEEKNAVTQKAEFYAPPLCFNLWIWFFCAVGIFFCGKFAIKRLVIDWRPPETVKKT